MVLPEVCPIDNESQCKKKDCHLYHIDWRTDQENCSIGYGHIRRYESPERKVVDTYAEDTQKRLHENEMHNENGSQREHLRPVRQIIEEECEIQADGPEEHVIISTKEATVFAAGPAPGKDDLSEKEEKKTKLDRLLDMDDIPEDYEKEFWN